jgi:putative ABC transport system substrate-binding protein
MDKKIFAVALYVLLLAPFFPAEAQQTKKVPRIGLLLAPTPSFYSARVEAFRQGMRELGYVEGKNFVIEYRYAEGKVDRLPDLAADLVHLKVDLIVTASNDGVLAAKKATRTIPIVFATAADPVGTGLVPDLARPGGNITGTSNVAQDLYGKRLELLKESFPKATRVAFLWRSVGVRKNLPFTEMEVVAKVLGVKLQSLDVRGLDDFDGAFEAAKRESAQALIAYPDPVINAQQTRIVDFATKNRLPAMYAGPEFVDAGGLMSYAPRYTDSWRRAATYVDKILKGVKPADLPIEQPMKFEFIINLKAAKQIGVTIPPNVLARADRVIK